MPVRKHRPGSSGGDATQTAIPRQQPEWLHAVSTAISNSRIVQLVTHQTVDEDAASSLLQTAQRDVEQSAPIGKRPDGILGEAWDRNLERTATATVDLDPSHVPEMEHFLAGWAANQARYEAVAAATGVPAMMIAAIHYREASMDFGTYLHQGDPLGRPAVNHPANIPVFHDWEEAAKHALGMKDGLRQQLGIEADTRDATALATYAEAYNGLGYHYRDKASPYVYGGTTAYDGGLFVADGQYSASTVDRRPGALALMEATGEGLDRPDAAAVQAQAWARVVSGEEVLRRGSSGAAVMALQQRLVDAGYDLAVDGDFGPGTEAVVRQAQAALGLVADGAVGKGTAEKL